MTRILRYIGTAMVVLLVAVSATEAQQSLYRIRLQDAFSHVLSIDGPTTGFTTNWTLRFPSAGTALGSILYTSNALGQLGWLAPTTNGYVLTLSGGTPVWADPATVLGTSYWSLAGNAPTLGYNGTTGSFLGTTNTQPLVIATTNTTTAQPIQFFTNNVEKARIASTGELLVGTSTVSKKLTISGDIGLVGTGTTVTTTGSELVLEQNADTYGITRLRIQNRNGSNGALFEQAGTVNLCDFGFKPGTAPQSNIRLEARPGTIRNANNNTYGEFEFFFGTTTTPVYVFNIGQFATTLETGKFGIGLTAPTSPFHITTGITASSGNATGAFFNQTLTAAANNDLLYGVNITPTFTNGDFTGLTNYSLRSVYAGNLTGSAGIRGEATGNGGANVEIFGVWGIATNTTQASNTNAGTGIRSEGNNTTTDANSNIALQIVNGEFVVGRQAANTVNSNASGTNILAEDDNNTLTDQGPSGVVDITTTNPGNNTSTTNTLVVDNRYAKSTSIILLTVMNGGTASASNIEDQVARITARGAGTFTIDLKRSNPGTVGTAGTAGTVRVGFLIVNPGK